jgi:hypothetical protein
MDYAMMITAEQNSCTRRYAAIQICRTNEL